jgi:hypothetical protein
LTKRIKERAGKKAEIWFNDFLTEEMDEKTGQIIVYGAYPKTN